MKADRAPRNRTITLEAGDETALQGKLGSLSEPLPTSELVDRILNQNLFETLPHLPNRFVDLLIVDPPYNLSKDFNGRSFDRQSVEDYTRWAESWFTPLLRVLKSTASVYVCADWLTSASIFEVLRKNLTVRNRITWEREKGRGAKTNWKNCSEDIWFATASNEYFFNAEAVMLKRRVLAPYRVEGQPKDWSSEENGNFRLTHPSNFWSDITVPFWSMPENTDHPTQKPEKLIAKLVLASSRPADMVFDPFLGSGTTAVVCRKLGRKFVGVEIDRTFSLLAAKRLAMAEVDRTIQGYSGGVFWERNTLAEQLRTSDGVEVEGNTATAQPFLLRV